MSYSAIALLTNPLWNLLLGRYVQYCNCNWIRYQISSHLLDICQNCETDFIWNYGTADLALVPLPCVCSHVVVVHLV